MKQLFNLHKLFLLGMLSVGAFLFSCSDETIAPIDTQEEVTFSKKCQMVLNAGRPSYSDASTRAASSDWEDGSTIYINFENAGAKVLGMATYASSTGLWEVAYGGFLPATANGKCSLYYFEDADDINTKGASIGGTTGIFEDLNGVYAFDGEKISINARLTPKLGRVRFWGNKNDTIMLAGVKRYGYFDASSCTYKLDSTEVLLSATVQEGDKFYTPYYYGAMIEGNQTLELTDMKDAFARYCSDIFKAGNSGYMKIPHTDNFSGWMKNNPLSQSLVSINWPDSISTERRQIIQDMINDMIMVEGGKFLMGAQSKNSSESNYNPSAQNDEQPVHPVILSPFYMSRLEITKKQYNAVMDINNSDSDLPYAQDRSFTTTTQKVDIYYNTFIKKLNEMTGLHFSLPSEAEWEYAAQGGRKGTYKLYAGTKSYDTKYFVAKSSSPYTESCGSKLPNELGLYDMSGNVSELCLSVGTYIPKELVNPRYYNDSYIVRGGSSHELYAERQYFSTTNITITNRTFYRTTYYVPYNTYSIYSQTGFRIVLRLINY